MSEGIKRRIKIISLTSTILVICCVFIIIYLYEADYIKYRKNIKDGDYEIKFIQSVSHKGFQKELHIISSGKYRSTVFYEDGSKTVAEGEVDRKQLKKFIKFALEKGISNMKEDMHAEDIFDGSNQYLELRLGNDLIRCGGYMPEEVNRNFGRIIDKLASIVNLY